MAWFAVQYDLSDVFAAQGAAMQHFLPCLGCPVEVDVPAAHYLLCCSLRCPWTICPACAARLAHLENLNADATEKRCPKCGDVKPIDAFSFSRGTADGRCCYCRTCEAKRVFAAKRRRST